MDRLGAAAATAMMKLHSRLLLFVMATTVRSGVMDATTSYPRFGALNGRSYGPSVQNIGYSLPGSDSYFRIMASRRGASGQALAYELLRRSDSAIRLVRQDDVDAQNNQYGLMSCVPMFSMSRSSWSWFRTLHLNMDVCYNYCVDDGPCVAAAPLYRASAPTNCVNGDCLHTMLRLNPPMFEGSFWREQAVGAMRTPTDASGEAAFAVYAQANPNFVAEKYPTEYRHVQQNARTFHGKAVQVLVDLPAVRPSVVLSLPSESRNFPLLPMMYAPMENDKEDLGVLQTLYRGDQIDVFAAAACQAIHSNNTSFLRERQVRAAWLLTQQLDGGAGGVLIRWDANSSYGALTTATYSPLTDDAYDHMHRVNDVCTHTDESLRQTLDDVLDVHVAEAVEPDCYPVQRDPPTGPFVLGANNLSLDASRTDIGALAINTASGWEHMPGVWGCDVYGVDKVPVLTRNRWPLEPNRTTDMECPWDYGAAGRYTILMPGTRTEGYNAAMEVGNACNDTARWWADDNLNHAFGKLAGEPLRHRFNAAKAEERIQSRLIQLQQQFASMPFEHKGKSGLIASTSVMLFAMVSIWNCWTHEMRDEVLRKTDRLHKRFVFQQLAPWDVRVAFLMVYLSGVLLMSPAALGITLSVMEDYSIEIKPPYPISTVLGVHWSADPTDSRTAGPAGDSYGQVRGTLSDDVFPADMLACL